MLPQGMFSVAVATVLFPTLSRQAARRDAARHAPRARDRDAPDQPAADPGRGVPDGARDAGRAADLPARQVQRLLGTHLTSIALFWFAVSLPFGGLNLLLTRTFFALKRPWIPTGLAAMNIVVDIVVSVGLYKPLGIAGLVIGTAAANIVMTALQLRRLRAGFNGRLEGRQTTMITARIAVASALLAGVVVGRLVRARPRCSAARCRRRSPRSAPPRRSAATSTCARCCGCGSPRRARCSGSCCASSGAHRVARGMDAPADGRRFDAVVFDNDGLLLDTEESWTRAERELFERRGVEFTAEHKRELLGTSAGAAAADARADARRARPGAAR